VGEEAALGVGEDIDLNLAYAVVQLRLQAGVAVGERFGGARVELTQVRHLVRTDAGMVAIVRAHHLNLVDFHLLAACRSKGQQKGVSKFHQNTSFNANCNWRAGKVALKTPKPLLLELVPLTVAKLVLFNRLNASPRNCK